MARCSRFTGAILVLSGGVAFAQSQPIDTALKGQLALKANLAQKQAEAVAEADVAEAIKSAKKLTNTFPDKAVRDLKATMVKLDTVAGLSNDTRERLVKQVAEAIAIIQKPEAGTPKPDIDPKVLARIERGRKDVEAATAETKDVRETIDAIAKDYDANRERDAKSKMAELVRKYPNNPAVIELGLHTQMKDSITAARDISLRSAEGFRLAMNSVQESAIPVAKDMTFPSAKEWNEKIERRRKLNAPTLTAEEKKLIESLNTPIKTELRNAPFEEAVQSLSTAIDQKIYLDKKSLEDTGIDLRSTVTMPGGVTARSALRVMLQQQGLTFIIRESIIQVVSLEQARKVLVTRAYDVRDLVSSGGPYNGIAQWGPYLDAQQTYANAAILVEAVQKGVDPNVWKDTGNGPATITFHYPTMSLIVRAPSEVHAELYDRMNPPKK